MTSAPTYYKLDVQGIVYLVNPTNSLAYTYDLSNPVEIGKVVWTEPSSPPRMEFRADWRDIMAAKKAENVSILTPTL